MKLHVCAFASEIADGLVEIKAPTGWPMKRPVDIVKKDGTNHHPIWDEKRQRC